MSPEMFPFGCWGLPTVLLALLFCPGSDAKVYICPENPVMKLGESLSINCSTSCVSPRLGGLETSLNKVLEAEGAQWKLYRVHNVSEDTVIHCYFTCSKQQESVNVTVKVFDFPEKVLLKLHSTYVKVGQPFTVECRVRPVVLPLEENTLTLTLLRGKEPLHTQTFGRATAQTEVMIIYNHTAHREDHHHNFSCQAELDLRPQVKDIMYRTSEPQLLEIYDPGQDNQMVIIITVVSVLLFLFVTSVLLCFIFGQQWHQRRIGSYGVQAAWRNLRRAYRA